MTSFPYWSARVPNPGSAVLPSNATGLEQAMADVSAEELLAIDAELVSAQWDSGKVQPRNMPFLARSLGVNLWDERWPVAAKRRWLRLQPLFHSLRGTRAALEMAFDQLTFAGNPVRLVDARTGSQRFFLSHLYSDSGPQRQRWLARLPELRVYTEKPRAPPRNVASFPQVGKLSPRMFLGALGGAYVGFAAGRETDISSLAVRRAELIENGVTTPVGVASNTPTQVESFYLPARTRAFRLGALWADHTFMPDSTVAGLLTINRAGPVEWNVARQGVSANAQPIHVPITAAMRVQAFAGKWTGRFLTRDDAGTAYYESWRVLGRSPLPDKGTVVSFLDHDQLGQRPKTVLVRVRKTRVDRVPTAMYAGRNMGRRFLTGDGRREIDDVRAAIKAAGALGDRFLVDFETTKPTPTQARSFNDFF